MKKILAGLFLALAFFAGVSTAVFAAVGSNGSFENGTNPGVYTTLSAGDSTSITDWTVGTGTIDYIGTYWPASNGSRSVDLNGLSTGSINQTLTTVVGATYNITFDLSGNPESSSDVSLTSPSSKTLTVTANAGLSQSYSYDTSAKGNSLSDMKWEGHNYSFVATGTSTVLAFTSTTTGAFGPAIDNVVIAETLPTPTVTPTPVLVGPPTKESQCEHGGWKTFNNPTFKNEDKCEEYVESHKVKPGKVDGNIKMANPKQALDIDLTEGSSANQGKVEYQNFEYPGGLHYKTKALCVFVNKTTMESRFMYQIPAGFPGLSGLYIVAYVKDGGTPGSTHDLYEHTSTSDLSTAQAWCTTGVGFTPSMYPITNGNIVVH